MDDNVIVEQSVTDNVEKKSFGQKIKDAAVGTGRWIKNHWKPILIVGTGGAAAVGAGYLIGKLIFSGDDVDDDDMDIDEFVPDDEDCFGDPNDGDLSDDDVSDDYYDNYNHDEETIE